MKTTDKFTQTLKPETREKRRADCAEFYKNNKDNILLKAKIKRFKTKYDSDLVDEYVTKFGELKAINEIKKNISNHLGKLDNVIM
jgi:hypothetical protein